MEPTCRCHRGRSNSPLPAQQCCPRRAGLPAQCGSSLQRNDAGVWLCEYPGLSFQRSPVCACSLVSSLLLSGATMSQQSSLTQSAHSVRQVLTAYTTSQAVASVLPSSSRLGSGLPACRIRYSTGLPPAQRTHAAAAPSATSLVPFSIGLASLPRLQFQSANLRSVPRSTRSLASTAASFQPSSVVVRSLLMFV